MNHSVNSITPLPVGFSSVISLNDLRVYIRLGVGEDERKNPQEVNISFKFFSKEPPKGCITDDINDTVCYYGVSSIINNYCNNREFKLLEYLCNSLCREVRESVPDNIKIWVKAEKCKPPIENLMGSTSFEYTDIWQ